MMFRKQKKGILGLDTAKGVMLSLLTLAVVTIAVFLALVSLQNAGLFTTGSQAKNNTDYIINNITGGTVTFFTYMPTIFTLLGVVVIILVIAIVIVAVSRFGGSAGRESL